MTKDEVLDLALEELENCADLLKVFEAPIDSCVGATMLQAEATITAIKQALAAQQAVQEPVAWVLTEELTRRKTTTGAHLWFSDPVNCMWTPIYTTPPAAAIPDVIHHTDLSEHPQYIEGWNDCRAEMLKGMKP